jgi:hypothetical protein
MSEDKIKTMMDFICDAVTSHAQQQDATINETMNAMVLSYVALAISLRDDEVSFEKLEGVLLKAVSTAIRAFKEVVEK